MSPKPPSLTKLATATEAARKTQERADAALARRDAIAAEAADKGATYAALAEVMGITVDGVTYVLRKVRRAKTTT